MRGFAPSFCQTNFVFGKPQKYRLIVKRIVFHILAFYLKVYLIPIAFRFWKFWYEERLASVFIGIDHIYGVWKWWEKTILYASYFFCASFILLLLSLRNCVFNMYVRILWNKKNKQDRGASSLSSLTSRSMNRRMGSVLLEIPFFSPFFILQKVVVAKKKMYLRVDR